MSSHRVLLLEAPLHLSLDTGRIVIRPKDGEPSFVLPADVAVLILDHPAVALSTAVLRALAEGGCSVLVTDARHLPLTELTPRPAPTRAGKRLRQQLALCASPAAGNLWRDIVAARIRTEASVLRALGRKGALHLERLSTKVEPGDRTNCEGQAARHYWKHLFPSGFRRTKQGAEDLQNARLNYGYAIVRSAVARALVATGLQPMLGLGHHSDENLLNLADDFLEGYRFVVEQHVAELAVADPDNAVFDPAARKAVAACVTREVRLGQQIFRLSAAVEETVASFTRILDCNGARTPRLSLPEAVA